MRVVVMAVPLLLLFLSMLLMVRIVSGGLGRGRAALEEGSRWETHTEVGKGATTVAVRRVAQTRSGVVELGRQVIRTIPDDDPDWETKYHAAMAEARSRVAAFEIEAD